MDWNIAYDHTKKHGEDESLLTCKYILLRVFLSVHVMFFFISQSPTVINLQKNVFEHVWLKIIETNPINRNGIFTWHEWLNFMVHVGIEIPFPTRHLKWESLSLPSFRGLGEASLLVYLHAGGVGFRVGNVSEFTRGENGVNMCNRILKGGGGGSPNLPQCSLRFPNLP